MDSYFRARDILDKAMGTDSYFQIKSILFGLKAADVVEVRHGRWLLGGRCSECLANPLTTHKNYCPNCGARMDKEDKHEAG